MKSHKILFKFLRFLKPYWYQEIILLILMILTSAGTLVSPYILMVIIDDVFPAKDFGYLMEILLILVGVNIFRIVVGFISDYLYEWVSNCIMMDIRMELFNRVLHFPLNFFDKNKTGDLTHRVYNEVNTVQGMLTGSLVRFIKSTLTLIGLAIALCLLNYKLFIISVIILPFVIINMRYFQPKIHSVVTKSREKDSDILGYFVERFSNIKLIKSFNSYQYENTKLYLKIKELIQLYLKRTWLSSATGGISNFLITLSPVIIFGWGGQQVMTGVMTLGALIAFIQYLNRIFNPFNDLINLYWDLVRTSVSMKRIFDYLDLPVEKKQGIKQGVNFKDKIIFKKVCFSYDGHMVLNNFYLELLPGRKYAFVGVSGCGKSTVINLLCRFYELENGIINIGNKNIKEIDLFELRKHVALISQDNQLFNDSIHENIKYGNFEVTIGQIIAASEEVGLSQHVKTLAKTYDSIIGENGTSLSGGQKQRIAIARAVLNNSDIIILDEATSALDSESEMEIFINLSRIYRDSTMILISHRLSAIKNVDEIICMDQGKVIEKGSHDELVKKKGFYWQLFKQQIE